MDVTLAQVEKATAEARSITGRSASECAPEEAYSSDRPRSIRNDGAIPAFGASRRPVTDSASVTPSAGGRRRVLIVDDDVSLRTIMAEVLVDEGWQVRSACDGLDALVVLGTWLPDVVLLDLMMPRMDGRTFHAEMRRVERMARIPIVLVSAGAAVHRAAAELGTAGALGKPFELDDLLDCLIRVVGDGALLS
jgi:CheY-like chemotaxis protein